MRLKAINNNAWGWGAQHNPPSPRWIGLSQEKFVVVGGSLNVKLVIDFGPDLTLVLDLGPISPNLTLFLGLGP